MTRKREREGRAREEGYSSGTAEYHALVQQVTRIARGQLIFARKQPKRRYFSDSELSISKFRTLYTSTGTFEHSVSEHRLACDARTDAPNSCLSLSSVNVMTSGEEGAPTAVTRGAAAQPTPPMPSVPRVSTKTTIFPFRYYSCMVYRCVVYSGVIRVVNPEVCVSPPNLPI